MKAQDSGFWQYCRECCRIGWQSSWRSLSKITGTILISGARQLLTLRGPLGARRGSDLNELGIIPDGALLIRDGILREVGTSRRVENLAEARGAFEINAADYLLASRPALATGKRRPR